MYINQSAHIIDHDSCHISIEQSELNSQEKITSQPELDYTSIGPLFSNYIDQQIFISYECYLSYHPSTYMSTEYYVYVNCN